MKVLNLLEAPLPDDWDRSVYSNKVSFAKRIEYAKQKASRIGAGSSRVAFVIPYEGRETVLKIAKNQKGIAQNAEEVSLLEDWYLKKLDITIPMIDYDSENQDAPTWIHVEKADRATDSIFIKLTGMSLTRCIEYALTASGRDSTYEKRFADLSKYDENEFLQSLVDFIGNYTHVPVGDLRRLANWGVYQGRPVIVDLGLTDTTLKAYYS